MKEVRPNLFIGNGSDCFYEEQTEMVVIHACKDPCHKVGVGYRGNLSSQHPNYLIKAKINHLFLNLVDMNRLLPVYTDPIFFKAIEFIEKNIGDKKILVHCNQGMSRSPAIALVYLAKVGVIPKTSYQDAISEFLKLYPWYNPGRGVSRYLENNWEKLVNKS